MKWCRGAQSFRSDLKYRGFKHSQTRTNQDASAHKSSPPRRSNRTEQLFIDDQKPFFQAEVSPLCLHCWLQPASEEALLGERQRCRKPFKELTRNINAVASSAAGVIPAIAVLKRPARPGE